MRTVRGIRPRRPGRWPRRTAREKGGVELREGGEKSCRETGGAGRRGPGAIPPSVLQRRTHTHTKRTRIFTRSLLEYRNMGRKTEQSQHHMSAQCARQTDTPPPVVRPGLMSTAWTRTGERCPSALQRLAVLHLLALALFPGTLALPQPSRPLVLFMAGNLLEGRG